MIETRGYKHIYFEVWYEMQRVLGERITQQQYDKLVDADRDRFNCGRGNTIYHLASNDPLITLELAQWFVSQYSQQKFKLLSIDLSDL